MFIYNGKFNWTSGETIASNEMITMVFPVGFALNDPVSAYWQWSTDILADKKTSVSSAGVVESVTAVTADGYRRIHFSLGDYAFDASIAVDYKTLTVSRMRDEHLNVSRPFSLDVMPVDRSKTACAVYTGTLDFLSFARAEMVTLVVLDDVAGGPLFGLYHQWTINGEGGGPGRMVNHRVHGKLEIVDRSSDGRRVTAWFKDSDDFYYDFKFSGEEGTLTITAGPHGKSEGNKFALTYKI